MQYTVKQTRLLAGLTQTEMAVKLGVHRDTYRKIEQKPENTSIEHAYKIAEITGIPFEDIIFSENSTKRGI